MARWSCAVSEAGGPGLGSSLARACSAWPRGGVGLLGVVFFVPLSCPPPGQKHGSDGLARLKFCCDAADFFQAPRQEKQARSRQAIEVASEAHLTLFPHELSLACFFFRRKIRVFGPEAASSCSPLALERGLSAASLVAACCCSCLTSLCCGARRSFFCARFVESRCRVWKLALGSGSWVGGIEIETFDELCFKKSTS